MRGIGWLNLHGVNIYKPFRIKPSVCLEVPVRIDTENKQEVFVMKNVLQDGFHGFCMALADSVPGVSGGTAAFIMGFYDRLIGSINSLVFGSWKEKKQQSLRYLIRLGTGWAAGMLLAVWILSALFEKQIYVVSSLFIGFIGGSIPLVIREERESIREAAKGMWAGIAGALLVIAISAMFLPGISGSTLLLIFGAYIPVITAVRGFLGLDFSYFPALMFFGFGILTGAASVVKGIQVCLERFRPQAVYAILGMMIGSFYAIVQGPTTLETPQPALNPANFRWLPCLIGVALVIGMQLAKE